MRSILSVLIFIAVLSAGQAAGSPLLRKAADKWMGERDNWAFTLHVREYDGGEVKEEREERYDPSKAGIGRWELLSVNGNTPTPERRAEWQKRKTAKRKNPGKPLDDYLALDEATVDKQTDKVICYHVPLKNNGSWLFPTDKVELRVTVNRQTAAIEDVMAGIDAPFKVALGLGKVLDVDFDMQMNPSDKKEQANDPAGAKPDGTAKVVFNKLGERMEYAWTDFQRVTPHPDNVIKAAPKS